MEQILLKIKTEPHNIVFLQAAFAIPPVPIATAAVQHKELFYALESLHCGI